MCQKTPDFFGSFWEVFCLPHHTPYEFAKWRTLLGYIFVLSFISIAFVVVKLKLFIVFCTTSEFWLEVVSSKTNTVWKILQNFAYFGSSGIQPKFTILINFEAQFTTGKPTILLGTINFCKNCILRNIR